MKYTIDVDKKGIESVQNCNNYFAILVNIH
jgi:hypothetical protein